MSALARSHRLLSPLSSVPRSSLVPRLAQPFRRDPLATKSFSSKTPESKGEKDEAKPLGKVSGIVNSILHGSGSLPKIQSQESWGVSLARGKYVHELQSMCCCVHCLLTVFVFHILWPTVNPSFCSFLLFCEISQSHGNVLPWHSLLLSWGFSLKQIIVSSPSDMTTMSSWCKFIIWHFFPTHMFLGQKTTSKEIVHD